MKLSRLYCNRPDEFPPIKFNAGLNVVLAEIRDPKNLAKDTHNLGKTTLAAVIDFMLLKKVKDKKKHFLLKRAERFGEYVFYLEISVSDCSFITIRRAVDENTKISFFYSESTKEDLNSLPGESWDHWRVPIDAARTLLDGSLSMLAAAPWAYRKPLGYALRLQDDYKDVFQLDAYRGNHAGWKPFLAQLIGLDGQLVKESYDFAIAADSVEASIAELRPLLAGAANSPDQLETMILVRSKEVDSLETNLDKFDFKVPDEQVSRELVTKIEVSISALNERRYHLQMSSSSINKTLNDTIKFDLKNVEEVFGDADVYFGDQLKRDYYELLDFLTSISSERRELLSDELNEIDKELSELEVSLNDFNARRMAALASIREVETFARYRRHTQKLVEAKTTLGLLRKQREQMGRLEDLKRRLVDLKKRRSTAVEAVVANLKDASGDRKGIYAEIRLEFARLVNAVLSRSAILSSKLNGKDNIEFSAEVVDDEGMSTSADKGHTYKKLLCVAFDMAVFSAYLQKNFVHFVYHDGVFESLDDRKKLCLLAEIRGACSKGLQQIITLIDSDLPVDSDGAKLEFTDEEVIRLLHDEGANGRLFRIESW